MAIVALENSFIVLQQIPDSKQRQKCRLHLKKQTHTFSVLFCNE